MGVSGTSNGIIGRLIAGTEFPRAFTAVKYIVYVFPFVNPGSINDLFAISVLLSKVYAELLIEYEYEVIVLPPSNEGYSKFTEID
jgi:hypothetical protein